MLAQTVLEYDIGMHFVLFASVTLPLLLQYILLSISQIVSLSLYVLLCVRVCLKGLRRLDPKWSIDHDIVQEHAYLFRPF